MKRREKLRELVKELLENQTGVEVALRAWVKDKSVPLEERWEVFVMSGLGECGRYVYGGFKEIEVNFFIYDGRYHCERYQTVLLAEVIEREGEENADFEEDENGEMLFDKDGEAVLTKEAKESVDAMKEIVLKDFIHSFVYDW
jgi:hypothetical protein